MIPYSGNETRIPLLEIQVLTTHSLKELQTAQDESIVAGDNPRNFAIIFQDSSMYPFFNPNSILIFDPNKEPRDRSYILAKIRRENLILFRQLVSDGNKRYLKSMNPDLSTFKMYLLEDDDDILGVLFEARNRFEI